MASTAFSSARSRRILRNGLTAAQHRRRSRGCIRPGVRTDPDCARAGAGGRFPDGAADPAVASRCRARASIRPSSPEARARSGRTSRRRSSPRSASRVASRIGSQRSATGDDDRDDEARHDRDDEADHDRDDRAFGGHDRRKQSRRSQRPRVRPHAGRGVRTRPSAPRPGRCRPRGNGAITEAYASYNLAFTRFALGSCDGVPLLDRSEDVQGERREIDALREDWEDRCAEGEANGERGKGKGRGKGDKN